MNEMINYNRGNPFRIFDYKNLGSVRIIVDNQGEPWFCLIDVCRILELENTSRILHRLKEDGITRSKVVDTIGRNQQVTFINESNLYELIFTSRKPEAKDLRYWLVGTVLPSIRKTGRYDINDDDTLSPTTKAIIAHDRRLKQLEDNYTIMEDRMDYYESELAASDIRQTELEDRQAHLIEEGYHAILRFAQYYGINTTERDRQILGKKATSICKEKGIPMGEEPAGRFIAHTYPYPVLLEVFQEFTSNNSN